MIDLNVNGVPNDEQVDRLNAAWNDIVSGRAPVVADDELVRLAQPLGARPTTVRERPGFRPQLRATIMQSPAMALPMTDVAPSLHREPAPSRPALIPTGAFLRRVGTRWVGLAATIALLLATAGGGYLATVGLPGTAAPATSVGALQATPESGLTPGGLICAVDPYTPMGGSLPNIVGSGYLQDGLTDVDTFPTEDFDVSEVQMQRWQVDGLQSLTFSAPVTPLTGLGMDIIINGAYTATFSGPATIGDDQSRIRGINNYVPANTVVELVSGDVVTYELGTKLEIRNPLESSLLQFKTVLFHDGDPSPTNLGAAGDIQMTVDGDGTLPKPLIAYSPSGAGIVLTYSQILEGYPFPPETTTYDFVLGPVDPVGGPVGTEGFILWVYQGRA